MEENKNINNNTNSSNTTTTTTENKLTLEDVLKGYRDDSAEKTIKRNEARDKYARIVNGAKAIGSIIGGSAYFSPSNTIQQAQQDNQNEIAKDNYLYHRRKAYNDAVANLYNAEQQRIARQNLENAKQENRVALENTKNQGAIKLEQERQKGRKELTDSKLKSQENIAEKKITSAEKIARGRNQTSLSVAAQNASNRKEINDANNQTRKEIATQNNENRMKVAKLRNPWSSMVEDEPQKPQQGKTK